MFFNYRLQKKDIDNYFENVLIEIMAYYLKKDKDSPYFINKKPNSLLWIKIQKE